MSARSTGIYRPRRAWRIATGYFIACWVAAWASGALDRLGPPTPDGVGWWVWFGLAAAVVVVGYWVVWPIGTVTHGRPFEPVSTGLFGTVWGVSEGLLLLGGQTVVLGWFGVGWATVFVSFLVLGGFLGAWHALFWDIEVAPPHNTDEWYLRKVLWVHVPNLVVSLAFLTLYDEPTAFVALQTVALLGSTVAMRFPAPGGAEEAVS